MKPTKRSGAAVPAHPVLEGDAAFPRGCPPRILLEQVRNTIPFLFDGEINVRAAHLRHLLAVDRRLRDGADETALDHVQYYRLCLSAHHATVASFVPTDVDNQIRFKLWHPALPVEQTLAMAELVEASLGWDSTPVSTRWLLSPKTGDGLLTGHLGEWFSTAAAAYAALKRKVPDAARAMLELIVSQVTMQASCCDELHRTGDGVGLLKAATLVAHNLGDLDRVIDMWALASDDPLRMAVYKAGHEESAWPTLRRAGALNKAFMAPHNHRHFALREARGLRSHPLLLVPISPFLDDWGRNVARLLPPEDAGEVVTALVHGLVRVKDTGYARALAGIEDAFEGGLSNLALYVPAKIDRALRSGPIRPLITVPQRRFEEHMAARALQRFAGL